MHSKFPVMPGEQRKRCETRDRYQKNTGRSWVSFGFASLARDDDSYGNGSEANLANNR